MYIITLTNHILKIKSNDSIEHNINILHKYKNEINFNDTIVWVILFIILYKRSM